MKNGSIVTFGYGKFIAEPWAGIVHLDELMQEEGTFIADIRHMPFASKDFPIWHGENLKERYGYSEKQPNGKRYARYIHIPELGNLNHKKEDRHKGYALQDKDIGLSRLILALSFGWRIVVLCGCKYYESCHRSLVTQLLLAELPNTTIMHVEQLQQNVETIKCLSIQQPWTHFIASGYKDVENRDWSTKYRGPVLLHAGGKVDSAWFDCNGELRYDLMSRYGILDYVMPKKATFTTGAIIGVADLVEVSEDVDSRWFCGKYGFVLKNARMFKEPIPYKGQLNLFNVPRSVVAHELERVETSDNVAPIVAQQVALLDVPEPVRWRDI